MTTTIKHLLTLAAAIIMAASGTVSAAEQPWSHGNLCVSPDGKWLQHTDGTPFFWLANTTWLMPQRLTRPEIEYAIGQMHDRGYNTLLVQVLNDLPSKNAYGRLSHNTDMTLPAACPSDSTGYWQVMDHIIDTAADHGIYIGMVCVWGGLVKSGRMDSIQAVQYADFLAERYRDRPNIVWIAGGDIRGDIKPQVWTALASTLRRQDPNQLITFHPFGRTSSAYWWNDAEWLDFNMFQSGHRRYDQTRGDGDDTAQAAVAEDNWRYAMDAESRTPRKPYLDAEPSYEDIPQGLHDPAEPRWQAADCRRYAWWSVLAGSAGHTFGNNSVMQMLRPGDAPAYGADTYWTEAIHSPGAAQMQHITKLISSLPWHTMHPAQYLIFGNGERYDRVAAARGDGFIVAYTYTNKPIDIDLSHVYHDGEPGLVDVIWYSPVDGTSQRAGTYPATRTTLQYPGPVGDGCDHVLVARKAASTM